MKRLALGLSIALAAYLATGLYFVQPDEQAVVQRFGAVQGLTREPGATLDFPGVWTACTGSRRERSNG